MSAATVTAAASAAAAVQFVSLGRRATACIRMRIPCADMPAMFGPAIGELVDVLGAQHIVPDGAAFAHHFACDEAGVFDFEVGFFLPDGQGVRQCVRRVAM